MNSPLPEKTAHAPGEMQGSVEPGPVHSGRVTQGSWMLAAPRHAFRSLRHRNFRLFLMGQSLSLVGLWMQSMALSWLVYRLSNSATVLGAVQFANQIPILFLGVAGGLVADRLPKKRLLLFVQGLFMLQAAILTVLVLGKWATIPQIFALSVFFGVINAFDIPIRQSFVAEMVPPHDLMNAIAVNSANFNLARLLGPAVAGFIVARWGEGACFLLNTLSFAAILFMLTRIEPVRPSPAGSDSQASPLLQLKEGFRYASSTIHVRPLLLVIAVASFFAYPYLTVMPVFARDLLRGDAGTLGILMSAIGLGALMGALTLALRSGIGGLGRLVCGASAGFGLSVIAFAFSPSLPLSCAALTVSGFCMMVHLAGSNTLLQTFVPHELRGRLMSIYSTAMVGLMPFGSLLMGWGADRIGARWAVCAGGAAMVTAALWLFSKIPAIRDSLKHHLAGGAV
jgi:MFS family permease